MKGKTNNDGEDEFVDDKLSAKILKQAQQQQQELEEEMGTVNSFKVSSTDIKVYLQMSYTLSNRPEWLN